MSINPFKKSDYQIAVSDLSDAEKKIERLLTRANEIDESLERSSRDLAQLDEQLAMKGYTDAPLAEIEAMSKTVAQERSRLEAWITQQTEMRDRLALDIAAAKLVLPAIEERIARTKLDLCNRAVGDAEQALWDAVGPLLPKLLRVFTIRRVAANQSRALLGGVPVQVPRFDDVWNDCADTIRARAVQAGINIDRTDVGNPLKGEPVFEIVRSKHLDENERGAIRSGGAVGLRPDQFLEAVAMRIERQTPTLPSMRECQEHVAEWTKKINELEDEIKTLKAKEKRTQWPDEDLAQGGTWNGAMTAIDRENLRQKIDGREHVLKNARTALENWRKSLAEHSTPVEHALNGR